MTDRISQAVLYGSVELALKQSFINVDDLLEWLHNQVINRDVLIAYNSVCRRRTPNTQYLKDGVHLLAKNPGLTSVAVMHKLDPSIKDRKEGESKELWNYVFESAMKARSDHNAKGKALLMLTGTGTNDFLRDNLDLLYGCRFWREVSGVSSETTNTMLLKSDWIQHLRSNGTVASALLKRVHFLQQHAPQYYGEVAYKLYYAKALALHKEELLTNLTQTDLVLFNTYFMNIIDTRLLTYDSLSYNIASLTPDVAGYVLGFPIHWFVPNAEQIHEALAIMKDKGIDDYCAHIKTQTIAGALPTGPHVGEDAIFSNNEDVYGEDIANYVPFDIIVFRNAKHIYRFTRPEFSNLTKSKKNHWTNEWLPASILDTIRSRLATACALGLPESRTLKEHLNYVKNHNFFQPSAESIPRSTPVATSREAPPGARPAPSPTRVVATGFDRLPTVSPHISNSPLNMDFDGDVDDDETTNGARGFYERLRGMFGNTEHPVRHGIVAGTPMVDPRTVNMFRPLIIHDDQEEHDSYYDEDNDEEDDVVPDIFDVSRVNQIHSPFSPDQDRPHRMSLAHNPTMEHPTTLNAPQQNNANQQTLAVDVRGLARQWATNPQMLDVARRVAQGNTNPQELFRLIFETLAEEEDNIMDYVD